MSVDDTVTPGGDGDGELLTIDELAARVGMTVRNIRAYASRGLIPSPTLSGRTGYYDERHIANLQLVREMIDRGYTLAAVERFLDDSPSLATHALDLLGVLDAPLRGADEPEVVPIASVLALSGTQHDDGLIGELILQRLAERVDEQHLRLLEPTVVRAGAQAIALGLDTSTVLALLPVISRHLRQVADTFVEAVRGEVWQPFAEAGMPDDQWDSVVRVIEVLLPVSSHAVLALFRRELGESITETLGAELGQLERMLSGHEPGPTRPDAT